MSSSSARARRDVPAHRGGDPRRSKRARCPAGGTEPYRARKGVPRVPFVQVNVAQSSGFDVYTRLSVSLSAEAALGHVVAGVEGDYRRRDALARRRQLMQQWADFIERPWQHGDNVVPIGAALFA